MPFHIIRNDITRLNTDTIVKAAYKKFLAEDGICNVIFNATGNDMFSRIDASASSKFMCLFD